MQDTIAPLDAQFDDHRVVRQLHDVPPHEVYEVAVDGRRAVFKRDTGPIGKAGVEGHVATFVGEQTSVPVPEVLAVGDDWYLAAWHPDAPGPDAERGPDEAWARAAGRGLGMLHAETADQLDAYGRFNPDGDGVAVDGKDDWRAAAMAYVRRRRPVLAEHGHADVADAVRDYLREHPDAFASVGEHSETTEREAENGVSRDGAGDPVCCHGWWTPEHVPVANGEVACVVDFEHALAAPGEYDYWRTVLPTFDGGSSLRAFREGYECVRALPDGFEVRRPLYVALLGVSYVESLYVQDQHGPETTAARASWLRESVFDALDSL